MHSSVEKSPTRASSGTPSQQDARLERTWKKAYAAESKEDLIDLYREWSTTYDADHEAIGFFGHRTAAAVLARFTPFRDVAAVLDAGAGTGSAGQALSELGFRNLSAIDLSPDMLAQAKSKNVYREVFRADLDLPIDIFPRDHFDAAILVGVFSYGQAPAHALDEIVRLVKPGGVVAFTMRADFFEEDAMGVRSKMEELDRAHAWKPLEVTDPQQYLPKKDPSAMFRVWCYRVLETKAPRVDERFAAAVREAFMSDSPQKRIDHAFIWDSMASRLYERYTECPDYYLTALESAILADNASEILDDARQLVELGCGSAKKVTHLLEAAVASRPGTALVYTPVDVSQGALDATTAQVTEQFGDRVGVVPRCGKFDEILASIPVEDSKLIVFFGGSLGNFETLEETVAFLETMAARMTSRDRFVVGIDLHKDEAVLRRAYEAGPRNRDFFLNMLRRMNNELGANFDLGSFRQDSPYERDVPLDGVETRAVQLRLVTDRPQDVYISSMHMEVHLDAGDAVQIGTSRKFETEAIEKLGALAGLRLRRQWRDEKDYFSLNEFVRQSS